MDLPLQKFNKILLAGAMGLRSCVVLGYRGKQDAHALAHRSLKDITQKIMNAIFSQDREREVGGYTDN